VVAASADLRGGATDPAVIHSPVVTLARQAGPSILIDLSTGPTIKFAAFSIVGMPHSAPAWVSMVKTSGFLALVATSLIVVASSTPPFSSDPARIVFDLPLTVECRDATPPDFAAAHPTLKVIEAKFQISARIVAGSESDIVDFLYIIASPDRKLRFQDYLPNTMLESAVEHDQIEIADTTERAKGGEIGAKVGYQGVGGGLSRSKSSKQTHSNRYKQITPRALVVASGTTDHEHGIFFKLKPSRAASLEGAKEFTFLATVPKSWRGGWCTISCAARAQVKTLFGRSEIVPAGVAQSQIGLYLIGDAEATRLAEDLGEAQQQYADMLTAPLAKTGLLDTMYDAAVTGHTAPLCGVFKMPAGRWAADSGNHPPGPPEAAVLQAQQQLQQLSE
jgi:hypothetical protein